jgi:heat shock protein HtpX
LETAEDKNYLCPLFKEVYDRAKAANPQLGNIDLGVIDSMSVHACALGSRTIAVTKGAMEAFSEDGLKALLSHEVAHILNRDTIATLYVLVGNGIFMLLILPIKLLCMALQSLGRIRRGARIVAAVFSAIVSGFLFLMQITMSVNSRKSEFQADMMAVDLGYGESMIEALYLLEKLNRGNDEKTIAQLLLASHSHISTRIKRLEVALGIQD